MTPLPVQSFSIEYYRWFQQVVTPIDFRVMEVIPLSCIEALQISNKFESFNDEIFADTLQNIVNYLQSSGTKTHVSSLCTSDIDDAFKKQTIPAFMTLFIESAKTDTSSEQLGLILDDCELTSHRKAIILEMYASSKQRIRARLTKIGTTPPHIVDVDWRLDYNLQNNQSNKVMKLLYTVGVKTDHTSSEKSNDIQFSCSREQLQDFVGKLKEAVKAVERASQS